MILQKKEGNNSAFGTHIKKYVVKWRHIHVQKTLHRYFKPNLKPNKNRRNSGSQSDSIKGKINVYETRLSF